MTALLYVDFEDHEPPVRIELYQIDNTIHEGKNCQVYASLGYKLFVPIEGAE